MLKQIRNICRENALERWFATDQPGHADSRWVGPIEYRFNSRGFRDREWPENIKDVIWCVGDSELLGTGITYEQACPRQLELITGRTTIDISIPRASNDWIARQCRILIEELKDDVDTILIQWSFTTRSELSSDEARNRLLVELYSSIKEPNWPSIDGFFDMESLDPIIAKELTSDPYYSKILAMQGPQENAQIHFKKELLFDYAGAKHTISLMLDLEKICRNTQIIHSFVPKFAAPDERVFVYQQLSENNIVFLEEYEQIDMARDRSHSGPQTHRCYAERVAEMLWLPNFNTWLDVLK